jgi:histone H3/H4
MAQNRSLKTGHIGHESVAKDGSVKAGQFPPVRKVRRQEADSHRLQADVAEALFEVHRLEAIVEDLAVVVARVGRVTVGIGDVEDRLDHLDRTFGT